jgi:hypothetical protein
MVGDIYIIFFEFITNCRQCPTQKLPATLDTAQDSLSIKIHFLFIIYITIYVNLM